MNNHMMAMAQQQSFFFYNPEQGNKARPQTLFSQTGAMLPSQPQSYAQHVFPAERPSSSGSHVYLPSNAMAFHTPIASPRPNYQKQALHMAESRALVVDTDCGADGDRFMYPATPPLSISGSVISSPPMSSGLLPTPTGAAFFSENISGVKVGCEGEVTSEILAGENWTTKGSPPLTPVFLHPPSVIASQISDLLSATSCPSLSPSPSPIPRSSVSETDFDFCDPRNLLVASPNSALSHSQLELPAVPTFSLGMEHDQLFGNPTPIKPESQFGCNSDILSTGLPVLDGFSEFDPENDFITKISAAADAHYLGSKRQRLEPIPFADDEFLSGDRFEEIDDFDFSSCGSTPASSDSMNVPAKITKKPVRKNSKKAKNDKDSKPAEENTHAAAEDASDSDSKVDAPSTESKEDADGENTAASTPAPSQPVARRGRKQSLTEDPSKAFKCELCNRRFRRQEHLKRHYRSLHTADKPFQCDDCGKKFSRSDNLAQHQRTHGSGAVVMGVYEEGQYPSDIKANLGDVLYEAAAGVSSSGSDNGSTPPSSGDSQRKRKRDE